MRALTVLFASLSAAGAAGAGGGGGGAAAVIPHNKIYLAPSKSMY
jgi:hypothetical protein